MSKCLQMSEKSSFSFSHLCNVSRVMPSVRHSRSLVGNKVNELILSESETYCLALSSSSSVSLEGRPNVYGTARVPSTVGIVVLTAFAALVFFRVFTPAIYLYRTTLMLRCNSLSCQFLLTTSKTLTGATMLYITAMPSIAQLIGTSNPDATQISSCLYSGISIPVTLR